MHIFTLMLSYNTSTSTEEGEGNAHTKVSYEKTNNNLKFLPIMKSLIALQKQLYR